MGETAHGQQQREGTAERPDLVLLREVAAGDEGALLELRRRHGPGLRRFLRLGLREAGLLDEVLADTWIAVWQGAHGFAGTSQVRTWIYGVARNCRGQALRRRRRLDVDPEGRPRTAAFDEVLHGRFLGAAPDPADVILGQPFASGLTAAVARLPAEQAEVLQLAFDARCTYAEIAEILDVPETTVRMRLHRARERLRAARDVG